LVDGEQLFSFASLVFLGFYFSLSVIFLFITSSSPVLLLLISIIKLFLSQSMSFLTFTLAILFPHAAVGGVCKWLSGA